MNRFALGLRTVVMLSAAGLLGCGGSGIRTAGGGNAGMGGGIEPSGRANGGRGGGLAGTDGQGGVAASASGGAGGATGPGGAVGYAGSGRAGSDAPSSGATGGVVSAGGASGGASSSGGVPGGGGGGPAGGAAGAMSSLGGASGAGGGIEGRGGGAGGAGVVPASCEGTAPCGGSLVGSWRFASICLDEASISGVSEPILSACPGATVTNVATSHSGSIAFTASDYTATARTTLSFTLTMPVSCIGGAVRCADLGDRLASNSSVASASCSGSTVCTCTFANPPVITNASGTYLTSGATVTFLPDNGPPSSASYCVKADQLHILDVETITSMGSLIMRTRSDEVADRQ